MLHSALKINEQSMIFDESHINRKLFASNKKSHKQSLEELLIGGCFEEFVEDQSDTGLSFDSINEVQLSPTESRMRLRE